MNAFIAGDGGWGSAIALLLHGNGHAVSVWGPDEDYLHMVRRIRKNPRYLASVSFPPDIRWTAEPDDAATCDLFVMAIPSPYYRSVAERFADVLADTPTAVSVTKGLDPDSRRRMSDMLAEYLPAERIAVLSGPSFAEEVAHGRPTAVTVASSRPETAEKVQHAFSNDFFRAYTSTDVVGVELGGTLKNVMAIASGVCDGLGLGTNARAALITRGLAEIVRLGSALGAQPETFRGLSGIGDLILTCTGALSRNRSVGERLGRGETMNDILEGTHQVAEGVLNSRHVKQIAEEHGIEVPITQQVYRLCHENRSPRKAVTALLSRDLKEE